ARITNAMAGTKNQSGKRMWPFTDVSLETATLWGETANIVLLICLLGGVLATFVIVRTTNVKEHHWDRLRQEATDAFERLRINSAKENAEARSEEEQKDPVGGEETGVGIKEPQADSAGANARAQEARARAEELTLEIARLKAPRTLTPEQQSR